MGGGAFKLAQEGAPSEAGQRAEDTAKNARRASFVLVWGALSRGGRRFGRHDVAARLRRVRWEPRFHAAQFIRSKSSHYYIHDGGEHCFGQQ